MCYTQSRVNRHFSNVGNDTNYETLAVTQPPMITINGNHKNPPELDSKIISSPMGGSVKVRTTQFCVQL